jgi:hypothetical protein
VEPGRPHGRSEKSNFTARQNFFKAARKFKSCLCRRETRPRLSYPYVPSKTHNEAQTELGRCPRSRHGRRRRGAGCDSLQGDLCQLEPGCPPSAGHYKREIHRAYRGPSRIFWVRQATLLNISSRTNNLQPDPRPALAKRSPTSSLSSTPSCDERRLPQGQRRLFPP